jgi:hypothetical protein
MSQPSHTTPGMGEAPQQPLGYFDLVGEVAIDLVAEMFAMSRAQLADQVEITAETAGLKPEVLQKARLRSARKTQARLREMLEIVARVEGWAGGRAQAMAWYRAQPIPAFGGRTAEALVKSGHAAAVRDYLDHLALGGYA